MKFKTEYRFTDYYHNKVFLSFEDHPFSTSPKHVITLCFYKGKWLLTNHKSRGLEFPGGKVEPGETAEEAAIREVFEETGGVVKDLNYVGQYRVDGKREEVIKNVYFATIEELKKQPTYFETLGPVLLEKIPSDVRRNRDFSFIMKDGVVFYSLQYVKKKYLSA